MEAYVNPNVNIKDVLFERKNYSVKQLQYFTDMETSIKARLSVGENEEADQLREKLKTYESLISRLKIDIDECNYDLSKL